MYGHTHKQVTYVSRSVESRNAALTVNASRVVTAAYADSAPFVLTVNVQAERQICHCLIKVAFFCLTVAVTLWKHTEKVGGL